MIPRDPQSPRVTSGIRLGGAALSSRGFKENDFKAVALWILRALKNSKSESELTKIRGEIRDFCQAFPLFQW